MVTLMPIDRLRETRGFTLIELLVVMVIISTLLTLAVPRYFASVERSKEAVLRQNLRSLRDAIDKYYADNDRYPDSLETLATGRYLRSVPLDPITGSAATWVIVSPAAALASTLASTRADARTDAPGGAAGDNHALGAVYDVKSGAPGNGSDGTPFADW